MAPLDYPDEGCLSITMSTAFVDIPNSGRHMTVGANRPRPLIDLRQYAVTTAERNDAAGKVGWAAAYHYVVENGHYHVSSPLPEGSERMERQQCFYNGFRLVTELDLNYAEGVARSGRFTTWHAWGVTDDGLVVDPTWDHPEENQYFGIAVRPQPYAEAMCEMSWGMSMPLLEAVFVLKLGNMPELLVVPNWK
jgi:hypothetical protein